MLQVLIEKFHEATLFIYTTPLIFLASFDETPIHPALIEQHLTYILTPNKSSPPFRIDAQIYRLVFNGSFVQDANKLEKK